MVTDAEEDQYICGDYNVHKLVLLPVRATVNDGIETVKRCTCRGSSKKALSDFGCIIVCLLRGPRLMPLFLFFAVTSRYLDLADISTLCDGGLGDDASVPTVQHHSLP
jgi:hypothetical protein